MTDDASFDDDLEAAYRRALRAVSAADLPDFGDSPAEPVAEAESEGERPDILPMNPAWARPSESAKVAATPVAPPADAAPRVTPRQVLEAAVFVGGVELTAEKLASVLKGEFTPEFVARTLDELNRRYAAENRPYEIRCEEGFYRLALRAEHEPLRRRVFGLGPKEVKLTQEALEVLSLVAYRQPISRVEIEAAREGNVGNVLRQLVRRQLVALQRGGDDEVRYVTTPRFLEVFGLADLEELPRAEDLTFK